MSFASRVEGAIAGTGSLLCLGLDPDIAALPDVPAMERWCAEILDACLPHACAVKPNMAFFEQYGPEGLAALRRLRDRVPADRLVILDAKRGDIGNTAAAYARALFDVYGADAVTANPLMGEDSVRPFLDRIDRGCFLVARSSNPGAADLLELELADGTPVYEHIASLAVRWDGLGNAGLVVGATAVDAIAAVRRRAPLMPLLIPGVGAQGGSLEEAVAHGLAADGTGVLVNVGRAILGAPDPGAAAEEHARRLRAATLTAAAHPAPRPA